MDTPQVLTALEKRSFFENSLAPHHACYCNVVLGIENFYLSARTTLCNTSLQHWSQYIIWRIVFASILICAAILILIFCISFAPPLLRRPSTGREGPSLVRHRLQYPPFVDNYCLQSFLLLITNDMSAYTLYNPIQLAVYVLILYQYAVLLIITGYEK